MPPVYVGFYDGGPSHLENYEEKAGIVRQLDLIHWQRLTHDGPYVVSPHAEVLAFFTHWNSKTSGDTITSTPRADGAHEIRMKRFPKH